MSRFEAIFLVISLCLMPHLLTAQDHWPRFRGPNGSGIGSNTDPLPAKLDPAKNLAWRTPLAKGHSSPAVWGDHIFLTLERDTSLITACIDRRNGKILWEQQAPPVSPERVHGVNGLASPTPVTDGERVYAYFGSFGLIAYDFNGKQVWERRLPDGLSNTFGAAASPILHGDQLIFVCDNNKASFIESLDAASGKLNWRQERTGFGSAWSTPSIRQANGKEELLVYGVWWLSALDLENGEQIWSVPGLADEPAVTPLLGRELIYVNSYNMKTNTEVIGLPSYEKLLKDYDRNGDNILSFEEGNANKSILSRYDADGEGDHPLKIFYRRIDTNKDKLISKTEYQWLIDWVDGFKQENGLVAIRPPAPEGAKAEIVWRFRRGVPEIPSPIYHDGLIYMIKNGGILTCLDAETGALHYQQRIRSGGPYYASPVIGDNKLYLASARGIITVVATGKELSILSRNDLGERIMATPAIVNGHIFLRTEAGLYAFGGENEE